MVCQAPDLILMAVTSEAGPLLRRLRARPRSRPGLVYDAEHEGRAIIVAVTGMGADRAGAAAGELIERHRPGRVLSAGLAGGLDPRHATGHLLIPAEVIDESSGEVLRPMLDADKTGRLLSAAEVLTTLAMKADRFARWSADAVDMESAAIGRVCDRRGVGWLCVRAISDPADAAVPPFAARLVRPDGRPDLPAALGHLLTRPHHLPALARLGHDARFAARRLADAVLPLL